MTYKRIIIFGSLLAAIIIFANNFFADQTKASGTPVSLTPTTTLAVQTGNNTAAAGTFPGCETSTVTNGKCVNNGDLAAANISKVNIHTLLPANDASTKIYTTYIPYWGNSSHPDIGYSSTNATQVAAEVSDLTSRGFDGVIVDWYGQGSYEEQGTELLKTALDNQSALTFSLMIDQGSIEWHSCYSTCSATQALLNTIAFARGQGYFSDAHYQTLNGKPIVYEFGLEAYPINWQTIESDDPDLQFIWENSGGFSQPDSAGAFAWPQPIIYSSEPTAYNGVDYLTNFYNSAAKDQSKYIVGATWKGFDDTVASWSPAPYNTSGVNGGRRIEQNCGETWLDTWSALAAYNGTLNAVDATTWQDYEEGTEIQTGIDNCVSISSSLSGTTLKWSITGQENTLDHYTAYISTDGQNLAVLADNISPSATSLDLSQYNIPSGNYTLYVQAVGKPSLANHMSNSVTYTVAGVTTPSCVEPTFNAGAVSTNTVAPGGTYTVTCDYGFVGPGIMPTVGSGKCTYTKFVGTAANFTCTAGTATGTFSNSCVIDAGNTQNYCLVSDPIASLTVATPGTPTSTPTSTPPIIIPTSTAPTSTNPTNPITPASTTPTSTAPAPTPAPTTPVSSGGGGGGGFVSIPPTPPVTTNGGTSSDNTESTQSLLTELQTLLAQLNDLLASGLTQNLSLGMQNSEVTLLQDFLNGNGYTVSTSGAGSPGDEGTYFGEKTSAALAAFQKANGLPDTGYFGPLTRAYITAHY